MKSHIEIIYRLLCQPSTCTQEQDFPVIISGNGEYIAIYGSDEVAVAKVYIFRKIDHHQPGYMQTQTIILPVIGQGDDYVPGSLTTGGLAFSHDGHTLAIGVPGANCNVGEVRIYKLHEHSSYPRTSLSSSGRSWM